MANLSRLLLFACLAALFAAVPLCAVAQEEDGIETDEPEDSLAGLAASAMRRMDTTYYASNGLSIRVHPQYYISESFRACDFDNKKINQYDVDFKDLRDTFRITIHDPSRGKNFVFPIKGKVTSGFGPRRYMGASFHYGTDVKLVTGDTILAAMDGTIRIQRLDRYGYGYFLVLTHDNGLESLYGHLSKLLVDVGTEVKAGQPIALGGSTGRSSGPHLHFEFRFMGEQFNPELLLAFEQGELKKTELQVDKSCFAKTTPAAIVASGVGRYYVIRSGDTLGHIASRYRTSVSRLCALNGINVKTILRPGRKLRVS